MRKTSTSLVTSNALLPNSRRIIMAVTTYEKIKEHSLRPEAMIQIFMYIDVLAQKSCVLSPDALARVQKSMNTILLTNTQSSSVL